MLLNKLLANRLPGVETLTAGGPGGPMRAAADGMMAHRPSPGAGNAPGFLLPGEAAVGTASDDRPDPAAGEGAAGAGAPGPGAGG